MKKFICIILVIISMVVVCGCSDNNYPTAAYDDLADTISRADMALANSNIEDKLGYRQVMHNLAYTVDRDKHYDVNIFYGDLDYNEAYDLPVFSSVAKRMNDNEYRKELEANMVSSVLDRLQSDKYMISDHGVIYSVILQWQRKDLFGNESTYAICDFDGNGTWDYGCRGPMKFVSKAADEFPSRRINRYTTISIYSDGEIIMFDNPSSDETMVDFEKTLS